MHVMCENNERYDCKTARWIQKQSMHFMRILNINDAWKNQLFEKQNNFMQKLLKAQYFMNEMHEYEIKSFF